MRESARETMAVHQILEGAVSPDRQLVHLGNRHVSSRALTDRAVPRTRRNHDLGASAAEYDDRLTRLREQMREQELDCLLCVSDAVNKGAIRYIAKHGVWGHRAYAVIPLDAPPTLVVTMKSQAYWAARQDVIEDVRFAIRPIEAVKVALRELPRNSHRQLRVGIVGMRDVLPAGDYEELIAEPGLLVVDADDLMAEVRRVRSPWETRVHASTGGIAGRVFEAATAAASTGTNELEIAADLSRRALEEGATDLLILMSQGPYLRAPADRTTQDGETLLVSLELAGPEGYWVEVGGSVLLGAVSAETRRLAACSADVFSSGLGLLRPGVPTREIVARLEETLDGWGYKAGIWGGHGIGLDLREKPLLTRDDRSLVQSGDVIGFHPHLLDEPHGIGIYLGDTVLVTDAGAVRLCQAGGVIEAGGVV